VGIWGYLVQLGIGAARTASHPYPLTLTFKALTLKAMGVAG